MFLSSSNPEINKSPQQAKNQEGESSSRPESSLLGEDGESDFAGDEESGPNEDDDLILFDDPHPTDTTKYLNSNQRFPCLASSLPNLPRTFQDNRKKKLKKKRPGLENGSPRISRKFERSVSLASIGVVKSSPKNTKGDASKFGFIALRAHTDLQHSIGRRRGIAGNINEPKGYLPVTIFMLFYFTNIFDEWIFNEGHAKGFPNQRGKAVRGILQKEILYSLRSSYFCPNDKIVKLHSILCPPESPLSFTTEIGKFLQNFLEKILNLSESIHYTSGVSEIIHVLKRSKETEKLSTLQDLFQYSMKFSKKDELKLLSIPKPALILTLQNFNKNPKDKILPHKALIPNVFLDISDVLIQLSEDTDETQLDSELNLTRSTNSRIKYQQKPESPFCRCFRNALKAIFNYLQNLVVTFPGMFMSSDVSLDDSWSTIGGDSSLRRNYNYNPSPLQTKTEKLDEETLESVLTNESRRYYNNSKPSIVLDLMSIVCLSKDGKYTVFVKCTQNPKRGWAPWVLFDPLDQGSPLVRRIEDFGRWIDRLERKPDKVKTKWNAIPQDIQKVLTESTLFIYHTKSNSETQNNALLSFVSEK